MSKSASRINVCVWAVLLVHGLLLARIAAVNAPVFDEIAHLPAGLSHWQFGNFDLYRVNPPLVRMLAVVPLLLMEPKTDWDAIFDGPFERPEVSVGTRFLQANGDDSFRYFIYARWAVIPISILGGWVCFQWSAELFDRRSGLIALTLWCFCPNILAWGATIMPDVGAAAFGVAAGYTFWRWLNAPSWARALMAGFALGMAELAKSTWIILFVLWPILWLAWNASARRAGRDLVSKRQLTVQLLLALYLLNAGYGFEESFRPLGSFQFISQSLTGDTKSGFWGNRFRNTWLERLPVPLPANYVIGIDVQKHEFEEGKSSYLRGVHKQGGWYHYYLYALLVKTPLGTTALLILCCFLMIAQRDFRLPMRHEMLLWIPATAVIVLVSSQTGFNRYLRYAVPALPFLFVAISRVGISFASPRPLAGMLCSAGLVSGIVGSLAIFPHSMSYFNSAVGGPRHGSAHLLDANIDWGQDLFALKSFVDHHPQAHPLRLAYFGHVSPQMAHIEFEPISANHVCKTDGRKHEFEPGWYAISVNYLYGDRGQYPGNVDLSWFRQFPPDAMCGYSIAIFRITPESLSLIK